jgi:hypothetical protein
VLCWGRQIIAAAINTQAELGRHLHDVRSRVSTSSPPPGLGLGPKAGVLMKLKLDLHDIYNHGGDIDRALRAIIDEAVAKKAPLVEIIPGKGSGALKKHVLRFLDQKEIKALYHRVEKDSNNFGRVFVHFRWK